MANSSLHIDIFGHNGAALGKQVQFSDRFNEIQVPLSSVLRRVFHDLEVVCKVLRFGLWALVRWCASPATLSE